MAAEPIEIAQRPYLTAICQEPLRIDLMTPRTFVRVPKQPITL